MRIICIVIGIPGVICGIEQNLGFFVHQTGGLYGGIIHSLGSLHGGSSLFGSLFGGGQGLLVFSNLILIIGQLLIAICSMCFGTLQILKSRLVRIVHRIKVSLGIVYLSLKSRKLAVFLIIFVHGFRLLGGGSGLGGNQFFIGRVGSQFDIGGAKGRFGIIDGLLGLLHHFLLFGKGGLGVRDGLDNFIRDGFLLHVHLVGIGGHSQVGIIFIVGPCLNPGLGPIQVVFGGNDSIVSFIFSIVGLVIFRPGLVQFAIGRVIFHIIYGDLKCGISCFLSFLKGGNFFFHNGLCGVHLGLCGIHILLIGC